MPFGSGGGGGGLPSQWSVGSGGSLDIAIGNDGLPAISIDRNDARVADLLQLNEVGGGYALEVGPTGQVYMGANIQTADQVVINPNNAPNAGSHMLAVYPASGANRFFLTRSLYMMIKAQAAPADAEIETSACAFWFDSTNGAAKLMLKGKTDNGTVVTATVPLA